jgi:hypothetical protein
VVRLSLDKFSNSFTNALLDYAAARKHYSLDNNPACGHQHNNNSTSSIHHSVDCYTSGSCDDFYDTTASIHGDKRCPKYLDLTRPNDNQYPSGLNPDYHDSITRVHICFYDSSHPGVDLDASSSHDNHPDTSAHPGVAFKRVDFLHEQMPDRCHCHSPRLSRHRCCCDHVHSYRNTGSLNRRCWQCPQHQTLHPASAFRVFHDYMGLLWRGTHLANGVCGVQHIQPRICHARCKRM